MRIFLAISPQATGSVIKGRTWLWNLYEPLLDIGNDVYLFRNDLIVESINAKPGSSEFRHVFSQKLVEDYKREHKKNPFNVFLSYFEDTNVEPASIDEIKNTSVLTCNFSCNNTHQFYLTEKIAPHFDYNLHSERDAGEKFNAIGANPVWFPMAANPKYYKPHNVPKSIDVSFVGALYAKRPYYIWHLLENGIDVHAYGPGWSIDGRKNRFYQLYRDSRRAVGRVIRTVSNMTIEKRVKFTSQIAHHDFAERLRIKYMRNLHFPISDEEMVQKYSESKISLGFLEVYDAHDPSAMVKQHLHLREFEALMSGALFFTNYCDELAEFYEPDKELVIYRNEHELLEKVKYYLTHPEEADKVRKAGHKRALSCHTYQKRFEELFNTIDI